MATQHDIIRRWFETIKHTPYRGAPRHPKWPALQPFLASSASVRVGVDRDDHRTYTLQSYGSHFELARRLPDNPLPGYEGLPVFLLNGDTYSATTSRHQSLVREIVTGPVVRAVIPYSALRSAGIKLTTIRFLGHTGERTIGIERSIRQKQGSPTPPGIRVENRTTYEYPAWTPERRTEVLTERLAALRTEAAAQVDRINRYLTESRRPVPWGASHLRSAQDHLARLNEATIDSAFLHRHGDGYDRVKVADTLYYFARHHSRVTLTYIPADTDGAVGDELFEWTETKHLLGEVVFSADVTDRDGTTRRATFLSGCDHNEPNPWRSYFLCELPSTAPVDAPCTVDEAYDLLKPESVQLAEKTGRRVVRQGDIFAIEIPELRTERDLTRAFAPSTTVQPTLTGHVITEPFPVTSNGRLLGTNHTATKVAHAPQGATLVKGCLRHKPAGRAPDHVVQKLGEGKTYWVVVKNTVPTS